MDFAQLKRAVLTKIAAHDGQWYWYQLDRAIISKHPQMGDQLMPAIEELEAEELIRIAANPERPDLHLYWITEDGRKALVG